MSGRRSRTERQAEYAKIGKNAKSLRDEQKTKNAKRTLWITIASCVFVLAIAILAISSWTRSNANNFSFSNGIASNGFWSGVTAQNFVELFDYQAFPIPRDVHEVDEHDLQDGVNRLLEFYAPEAKLVTDRAVLDGDEVNIDYVGYVDGEPFDNGSTQGMGTDVTAGSTDYIDDFLTQIIGHMPGETFDVEVTFPEEYGQEALNGKDAVFVTTINYINEYDVTDQFVAENIYDAYGWSTIAEMEEGLREELRSAAVENYVRASLVSNVAFLDIPKRVLTYQEKLITYQERALLNYYQSEASSYDMDLDTFLQLYVGVSDKESLIEANRGNVVDDIKRSIAVQAIAEGAGISISEADMVEHIPDYTNYESQYGLPWLKQYVLGQKVVAFILDHAIML